VFKRSIIYLGVLLVLTGIFLETDMLSSKLPVIEPFTARAFPIELKRLEHRILLKDATFPGIVFNRGGFFVTAGVFGDDHLPHQWVFRYDAQLKPTGWSKPLTHTGYVTGEPDAQIEYYRGNFYQTYNAGSQDIGSLTRGDQLWLAKYDEDFNLVKSIQVVRDAPPQEETNDMFMEVARDRIYVGTDISALADANPLEGGSNDQPAFNLNDKGLIIRIFDLNLKLLQTLRLEGPGLYMRTGGHLMWVKPYFYLCVNTLTSFNYDPRDLCVLIFDEHFKLLRIKKLTDSLIYVEKFPQGVLSSKGRFYIPYTRFPNVEYAYTLLKSIYYYFTDVRCAFLDQRCYPQDTGEIWINIYDLDFNLLKDIRVRDNKPRCGVGSHRAHLAKNAQEIYVLYDTIFSFKPDAPQVEADHFRVMLK
jgi:hypothetical protein